MKTLIGAPSRALTAKEYNNHLSDVFNRSIKSKQLPNQIQYGLKSNNIDISKYDLVGYVKGDKVNKPKNLSYLDFDCLQFHQFSGNTIDEKKFVHLKGFKNSVEYLLIFKK